MVAEDCMGTPSVDVEQYLTDLRHPLKEGVLQLRAAILASDLAITEHVKWNAPSFCYGGQDRVTFRLQPRGRLQLISTEERRSARTAPASSSRIPPG
jgi:hypothetical protein